MDGVNLFLHDISILITSYCEKGQESVSMWAGDNLIKILSLALIILLSMMIFIKFITLFAKSTLSLLLREVFFL